MTPRAITGTEVAPQTVAAAQAEKAAIWRNCMVGEGRSSTKKRKYAWVKKTGVKVLVLREDWDGMSEVTRYMLFTP